MLVSFECGGGGGGRGLNSNLPRSNFPFMRSWGWRRDGVEGRVWGGGGLGWGYKVSELWSTQICLDLLFPLSGGWVGRSEL